MALHRAERLTGIEPDVDSTMLEGQPVEALQLLEDDLPVGPFECDADVEIQIWHLRPEESTYHYGLFRLYCYLANSRNYTRVAKKTGLSYLQIRDLATKYEWQERSRAYDTYWVRRQDEARRKAQDLQAAKWAKRADTQKEWEWDVSVKLRRQIEEMLAWPLFVETFERTEERLTGDGIVVQNIIRQEPAEWDLADMTRFLLIQSKFARLATGLDDKKFRSNVDVTKMTDAELEAMANET